MVGMTMGETPHKIRARSVAILGTGSDVVKSLVAAGVCRLLCRAGANAAPFKGQNMSLNSFVTPDGGEMGRAQVLQAQAWGVTPSVVMNPILLTKTNVEAPPFGRGGNVQPAGGRSRL